MAYKGFSTEISAAVALAARRPGTRVVYDSHEWFPFQFTDRNVERYWLEIECTHIKQADAVITVNESIADELAGCHGIDTPAVVYNSYGIGNGVEEWGKCRLVVEEDGTVSLYNGYTEMGQGLFQKVAQVAAARFGIDTSAIKITATDTGKVPNTSATAASALAASPVSAGTCSSSLAFARLSRRPALAIRP